jgi:hypothetical protein
MPSDHRSEEQPYGSLALISLSKHKSEVPYAVVVMVIARGQITLRLVLRDRYSIRSTGIAGGDPDRAIKSSKFLQPPN